MVNENVHNDFSSNIKKAREKKKAEEEELCKWSMCISRSYLNVQMYKYNVISTIFTNFGGKLVPLLNLCDYIRQTCQFCQP